MLTDETYKVALTKAEEYETPKCMSCGNHTFYNEGSSSFGPGHIYSKDGVNEMRISKMCEYCFDELFKGYEDGPDTSDGIEHGSAKEHDGSNSGLDDNDRIDANLRPDGQGNDWGFHED